MVQIAIRPTGMDDRWLKTHVMHHRMMLEAEDMPYIACTVTQDRQVVFDKPGDQPDDIEMMFIIDMATALFQNLAHDGKWVVMLTHPLPPDITKGRPQTTYTRRAFVWFDTDGDPQFTVDNEEPWPRVLGAGQAVWLEQCEIGWQGWKRLIYGVLQPDPEKEQFKGAQGQIAPSKRR